MTESEKKAKTAVTDAEIPASSTASLAEAPETPQSIRNIKIAGIRKALKKGGYRVNAADVADKLIEHMLGKR